MKAEEQMPDEKWQAIISNDASYDGRFIYAVKTTGIFCRPSCKSKAPNKENVRLFENAEQARSAHFRPCKRCKPTGERLPDDEWVNVITQYIDSHYRESLTLDTLAEMCHGSPYHLQRTFKRVKGMTPIEYIQQTRMIKAKEYLAHTDRAVSDIASNVGMPNTSYFITLFKRKIGRTPSDYRHSKRHSKQNNEMPEVPHGGREN